MRAFGTVRLGVAIAGALLAGTVALAQAPGGGMGPGPGFGEHRPPMERAFGPEGGPWPLVEQSQGRGAAEADR